MCGNREGWILYLYRSHTHSILQVIINAQSHHLVIFCPTHDEYFFRVPNTYDTFSNPFFLSNLQSSLIQVTNKPIWFSSTAQRFQLVFYFFDYYKFIYCWILRGTTSKVLMTNNPMIPKFC